VHQRSRALRRDRYVTTAAPPQALSMKRWPKGSGLRLALAGECRGRERARESRRVRTIARDQRCLRRRPSPEKLNKGRRPPPAAARRRPATESRLGEVAQLGQKPRRAQRCHFHAPTGWPERSTVAGVWVSARRARSDGRPDRAPCRRVDRRIERTTAGRRITGAAAWRRCTRC